MRILTVLLLTYLAYGECGRRVLKPLDKSANVDFINMEAGGGVRPAPGPVGKPTGNPTPTLHKASVGVVSPPNLQTAAPLKPQPKPVAAVATVVTPAPKPVLSPAQPNKAAPAPAKSFPQGPQSPTTPGPGSVKQLITFYDSRGQASPIRPYSYSQAVKQGKH